MSLDVSGQDANRFMTTDALRTDLPARSVRAGVVAIGARVALAAISAFSIMWLARLLTPADFGLLAMVLSLTAFIGTFRDAGLPLATVYHEGIDHDQVSALWWVNVNVSALIAFAIAGLAPGLAWFYGEPRLTVITLVMSVITFGESLGVQHEALLMRQMRFATLSRIEVGSALAGFIAGVALALAGAGYWALVAQYGGLALTRSALLWAVCGWRPTSSIGLALLRDARLRALLSYGLPHAGSRVLSHLGGHLDRILVGYFAGAVILGLYGGASRLAELPYRQIHSPLVGVAVATLSRLQHDGRTYRAHARTALLLVFTVSMPMLAFLFMEARSVVMLLLGDQWLAAVPLLRVLCVGWFALSVSRVTKWFYLSQGTTKRELAWNLLSTLVMVCGVGVGAQWGAIGIAAGFASAAVTLTYPSIAFCLKTSHLTKGDFFGVVWRPACASLAAAGTLFAADQVGWPEPANAAITLLTKGTMVAVAFVVFWLVSPGGLGAAAELAALLRARAATVPGPETPSRGPEVIRAPLRAVDWRFLLPPPPEGKFRHLVLLGGPPGVAERINDLGLARMVSRDLPSERSVDAVVVLQDARVRFRDVARCLLPGGALYYEINRRSPRNLLSTPRQVRRALRRAGLLPTGAYAVGPKLSSPRVYLPIDIPGAFGWYIETLFNAWTPALALVEKGLRVVTGLDGRRFAPFALDLAVTAVSHGTKPTGPAVLALPILPRELAKDGLHAVMLTSTHLETLSQRVVILPFTADGTRPLVVIKISKLQGLNATLQKEQETLADIRRILDPQMRRTIPEPLGTLRYGDMLVATESYSSGESLQRSSGRWGTRLGTKLEDLRLATEWLAEFHTQTEVDRAPWGASRAARGVDAQIEAYGHAFGATSDERALFTRARSYAESLKTLPLPIVWRKPDFFGSNVVRAGRELSVVDWESPHLGPALCDLIRFVTPWSDVARHARGARTFDNFRRLFFPTRGGDAISEAVHAAFQYYLERLSMSDRFLPVLLVYTWVDRALHHLEKQRLQGQGTLDTRVGNRHVGRVAVLAQHIDQLFDLPGPRSQK